MEISAPNAEIGTKECKGDIGVNIRPDPVFPTRVLHITRPFFWTIWHSMLGYRVLYRTLSDLPLGPVALLACVRQKFTALRGPRAIKVR